MLSAAGRPVQAHSTLDLDLDLFIAPDVTNMDNLHFWLHGGRQRGNASAGPRLATVPEYVSPAGLTATATLLSEYSLPVSPVELGQALAKQAEQEEQNADVHDDQSPSDASCTSSSNIASSSPSDQTDSFPTQSSISTLLSPPCAALSDKETDTTPGFGIGVAPAGPPITYDLSPTGSRYPTLSPPHFRSPRGSVGSSSSSSSGHAAHGSAAVPMLRAKSMSKHASSSSSGEDTGEDARAGARTRTISVPVPARISVGGTTRDNAATASRYSVIHTALQIPPRAKLTSNEGHSFIKVRDFGFPRLPDVPKDASTSTMTSSIPSSQQDVKPPPSSWKMVRAFSMHRAASMPQRHSAPPPPIIGSAPAPPPVATVASSTSTSSHVKRESGSLTRSQRVPVPSSTKMAVKDSSDEETKQRSDDEVQSRDDQIDTVTVDEPAPLPPAKLRAPSIKVAPTVRSAVRGNVAEQQHSASSGSSTVAHRLEDDQAAKGGGKAMIEASTGYALALNINPRLRKSAVSENSPLNASVTIVDA